MAKAAQIAVADDFILGLADQAAKEAAALQGGQRVQPPYFRIGTVKEGKSGTRSVVELVNPNQRDDKNNPTVTQFDSVPFVLLAHVPIRRLFFNTLVNGSKRLVNELFSVGPKKNAIAVGSAIGGVMAWEEVEQHWPDGFDRTHIPYGTEQVTKGKVKPESRYYAVVGISGEVAEAAGTDIAFLGLSMSSTYGISVKQPSEFEDKDLTLLGFPNKADPDSHKGVLHRLVNRPWQLGLAAGLPEDKAGRTPQYAIWLNLIGSHIGDTTRPVHAFEIGEELTREQLVWAKDAEARGIETLKAMLEQDARDAYPQFAAAQLPKLSAAAVAGDWGTVGQTLRIAAPVAAEVVEDEAPIAEAEDLGVATASRGPTPAEIDDEFPPEEDLPF